MRLLTKLVLFTSLVSVLGGSVACTRAVDSSTLKLSFSRSGAVSGQGVKRLEFAVVNVRGSGPPIVVQKHFDDSGPADTDKFTLEIPDVPTGSVLVQFFGVYRDPGQPSTYTYGDANATVTTGDTPVNITATALGTFSREGRVAGRYFDASGAHGPTGQMAMLFTPPGRPPITLQYAPIVDGYFNLIAVDGVPMDYVLGTNTLFPTVKLVSGELYVGGTKQNLGPKLAQFSRPASVSLQDGNAKPRPPTDIFTGFFAASGVDLSASRVCYANDINETQPGAYYPSSTQQIAVVMNGSSALQLHALGGYGTASSGLYVAPSGNCAPAYNHLTIYHTMLNGDDDLIRPPFAPVAPFAPWDKWIRAQFVTSPMNAIRLSWRYLPGIDPAAVAGVSVLAKAGNSGDDGGGDETCEALFSKGYSVVYSTSDLTTTSYDFSSLAGQSVTLGNKWNWRFALCPYQTSALGQKVWLGGYVSGGQLEPSNKMHSGWSNQVATINAPDTYQNLGGSTSRVLNVTAGSDMTVTALTLPAVGDAALFPPGTEVMFTIMGQQPVSGTPGCGQRNGEGYRAGQYGFARVLGASGASLLVERGSIVDQVSTSYLANDAPAANWCYVQIARVLQFRDLTVNSTVSAGSAAFNFSPGTGSVLPLRVNGVFTLAGSLLANLGYAGAPSASGYGAGSDGPAGATATGTGGASASQACGGANYGDGGTGVGCTGSLGHHQSGFQALMYGGGGGGASGLGGGAGGGAIFIVANEFKVTSNSYISANGGSGSGSAFASAGGAGGSVQIFSRTYTGISSLMVMANGGNGAASSGGGGGGSVEIMRCAVTGTNPTFQSLQGSGGSVSATVGFANLSDINDGMLNYLCKSSY